MVARRSMGSRAASARARSRSYAQFNTALAGGGLFVGRSTDKKGKTRRHAGRMEIGGWAGNESKTRKRAIVDFARGSGVLTFDKSKVGPASRGLKLRYGKQARAHRRMILRDQPHYLGVRGKKSGYNGPLKGYSGLDRSTGYGFGGKKRRAPRGRRRSFVASVFDKLHPRGPNGRFVRK